MADNQSNQVEKMRWADFEEDDEDFVKSVAAPSMRLLDVLTTQPKSHATSIGQRPRWSELDDDEEEQEEVLRAEPKTRTLFSHRHSRILQRHQRRKKASTRWADLEEDDEERPIAPGFGFPLLGISKGRLAPILEGAEEDEEVASSSHDEKAGSETSESTDVPADEGSADSLDEDWQVVAPKKMKNKKAEVAPRRPAVGHASRAMRPATASAR
mmetsp:Transcript_40740/g.103593  ORF Transcript_40740/g.103593 Transcript_40740/m.103593 type:complete len:213 (+) Transcript_40740:96-734(+)